mmetsp:Transcript_91797/g.159219  ORF Transcript_91797/g.159219 Transcript_91797/m.159219 type:complete len:128 (-) Transcript_91797:590-973(-)
MASLAAQAEACLQAFGPTDLARTAWAFATLGIRNDRLLTHMVEHVTREGVMDTFGAHDVALLAWALTRLGARSEALATALRRWVAQADVGLLRSLARPEVMMLEQALAAVEVPSPWLLNASPKQEKA